MLETCKGRPNHISLSIEKTKTFDQVLPPWLWTPKWTKFFIGLFSPNLKPLRGLHFMLETCRGGPGPITLSVEKTVGYLPYMLETCKEKPRPISLHVEKTQNFDLVFPPQPWGPKWTKRLIGTFSKI